MYPIVERLFDRDDWILVYSDHLCLVFMKNSAENSPILKKFGKDKAEGFNTVVFQASARAAQNPANPYYLITLGKVFFRMGNYADAEKAFALAQQRDPDNTTVSAWRQRIKESGK